MLYVKFVLDRETLVSVAKREREKHVWFYIPGMDGDAEPYAVVRRRGGEYICYIKKKNLVSEETFRIRGTVERVDKNCLLTVKFDGFSFHVRLKGVVVPDRDEKFYDECREHLMESCLNKEVVVFSRKQNADSEFLAFVKLENSYLNKMMLRDGYARADQEDAQEGYSELEDEAKALKKGIWSK